MGDPRSTVSTVIKVRQTTEHPIKPGSIQNALLKVLNGKQAGARVPLTKPITGIGKKACKSRSSRATKAAIFFNTYKGHTPSLMAPPSVKNPAHSTLRFWWNLVGLRCGLWWGKKISL